MGRKRHPRNRNRGGVKSKAAIVVLADTDSPGDLGRAVNALTTAKDFKEAGDDVVVVFDGAGTKWIPTLSQAEHSYSGLFDEVRDKVAGAWEYCADAYGVRPGVEASGIELLDEYAQHPSLRRYAADGSSAASESMREHCSGLVSVLASVSIARDSATGSVCVAAAVGLRRRRRAIRTGRR